MNAVGMALDAADSPIVLGVCTVIVAVPLVMLLALVGHVVMIPVRKTAVGQWAGRHTETQMGRVRDAYAARKGTKAGAQ